MKIISIDNNQAAYFWQTDNSNFGNEFLISKQWHEIQAKEGSQSELLGLEEENKVIAIFTTIKKRLGLSLFYYYLPRGPVFLNSLTEEEKKKALAFLESEFEKRGAVFLRIEPREKELSINAKDSINLQPQKTLMLDLSLSLDDLLKNFHSKTRYNIKLAQKKGMQIKVDDKMEAFDSFWSLMTETGKRDAFKIHNKEHYRLLATADSNFIKLFTAEFNGKVVAAGLFSFYGNKVTYLHGASSYQDRQLMAPYLLQWTVIKQAQELGYKYYDFYGIDEKKWPGVTRFKKGFGGFEIDYAGTKDIILNSGKYFFYQVLRFLRRLF
jgi:peptidoglycan pentaglycine glycine transferase (the first glycine)